MTTDEPRWVPRSQWDPKHTNAGGRDFDPALPGVPRVGRARTRPHAREARRRLRGWRARQPARAHAPWGRPRNARVAAPCGASPGRASAAGGEARKTQRGMQADARKTREWARARHGRSRLRLAAPQPGELRQYGSPCPIRVFCVHLPASALRPSCFDARRTLLRRTPDRARKPGYHAPIRPPAAAGSSSRPEADIIACCQNPMHQFAPPVRQDNSQGRETPHAQRAVARSVLLTVSPRSAHETMARLARDRSVRYFV
jgi:hypothetical protein